MRDPKRIDVILTALGNIWHKYPDMRLGQLIGNVLEGPSLYYVEDSGLINALKDAYEGAKEPVEFDDDAYILDTIKKHPGELRFVLDANTYKDYIASYETVSKGPEKDAELTEVEFSNLKNYFTKINV